MILALLLNGANLYGYIRCKLGHQPGIADATGILGQGVCLLAPMSIHLTLYIVHVHIDIQYAPHMTSIQKDIAGGTIWLTFSHNVGKNTLMGMGQKSVGSKNRALWLCSRVRRKKSRGKGPCGRVSLSLSCPIHRNGLLYLLLFPTVQTKLLWTIPITQLFPTNDIPYIVWNIQWGVRVIMHLEATLKLTISPQLSAMLLRRAAGGGDAEGKNSAAHAFTQQV